MRYDLPNIRIFSIVLFTEQYGWTALLWACDNKQADVAIVDNLLDHGADVNAEDVRL